ncbi:MAG: hypothetical protein ACR2RL_21700 [Gammaproteobacteria bacterium]
MSDDTTNAAANGDASDASESNEPSSMLDAITAGLAGETDGAEPGDAAAPTDGASDAVDAGEGRDAQSPEPADATVERSADEAGAAPEQGADGAGDTTGGDAGSEASATPAPKDGETQPEAAPAGDDAKPDDDLSAPEGADEKTRERFHRLTTRTQTLEAEAKQFRERYEQLTTTIRDAGASAEDMQAFLDYTRARSAGENEKALALLDAQRKGLAVAIGREVPGVDLLGAHPDLKERVAAFELSEDAAKEVARAREQLSAAQARDARTQQAAQSQAAEREAAQATQAAQQQGALEVSKLETQWRANDPDYEKKSPLLMEQMTTIAKTFPPEQWASQVRWQYEALGKLAAQAAPAPRSPAPLTGSGAAAGNSAAPGSMYEAMWGGQG